MNRGTKNGFIWIVDRNIPPGSQIIVGTDETLHVRAPDDTPIYVAKFGPGGDCDAVVAERDAAESIVRALAAEPPPVDTEWDNCKLCDADFGHLTDKENDPANHAADCVWRLAKEWIADPADDRNMI